MPEVEESRRGVVEPLWVREPRDREGGSWGGEKRSSCCRFSGATFARGSVDGDMLGRRDCARCAHQDVSCADSRVEAVTVPGRRKEVCALCGTSSKL